MNKQALLGYVLIAVVLIGWMWWTAPKQTAPLQDKNVTPQTVQKDSLPKSTTSSSSKISETTPSTSQSQQQDSLGKYFSSVSGKEKIITIKTDLYTAEISTKGGVIKQWTLEKYKTWDKHPVQLITTPQGDFSLLFGTTDGKLINTKNLYFTTSSSSSITLKDAEEYTLTLELPAKEGKILKVLRFKNGMYSFDANIKFVDMQNVIANYEYQLVWENSLKYTEYNSVDESNYAAAYSYSGGELTELNATSAGEIPTANSSGTTDWVALRTKYFSTILISDDNKTNGAYLEGRHLSAPNHGVIENYSIGLKVPYKNTANEETRFTVYIGPLDYSIVKDYNRSLEKIMSLGWVVVRPITQYLFIPLFTFLHSFISNYGLVIILFTILIKFALHPLTKSSMKSMKKMQKLQPMMEEIREKYKDDPNTMNVQIMKLYKDYGVNPAGGCLPFLLQMPILYALYSLFSSSIQLRQSSFIFWMNDLSIPDSIIEFSSALPIIGNHLSGLALLMGITTFIQQKMTVQDPRQKMLIWMMPVMLTVMFNNFPAGLNLYYFVFNLLSIVQQFYINKQHDNMPLQKVPQKKRGSFMERLAKNLPQQPKK